MVEQREIMCPFKIHVQEGVELITEVCNQSGLARLPGPPDNQGLAMGRCFPSLQVLCRLSFEDHGYPLTPTVPWRSSQYKRIVIKYLYSVTRFVTKYPYSVTNRQRVCESALDLGEYVDVYSLRWNLNLLLGDRYTG
ncbi:MAG TPA: hypothetical protein PLT42_08960, partial [Sphaerochaeta sp.]|nr:hypothetical protein [Sphaerochaeta sp.]